MVSVVGCDRKEDKHLNDKGNSVWAYLPGLDDPNQKFDSADVWREVFPFVSGRKGKITNPDFWPPVQRGKLSLALLRIFSVSLLSNWDADAYRPVNSKWIGYDMLSQRMSKAWTDLKSNTEDYINRKKQEYKDKYKSKWKDEWKKMLKDKYDSSEEKYKADLLAVGEEDNASLELNNVLISNNQSDYVTSSISTIQNRYQSFKSSGTSWKEWAAANPRVARLIVLSSTTFSQTSDSFWTKDEKGILQLADVQSWDADTFAARYSVPNCSYDEDTRKYAGKKGEEGRKISNNSYSSGLISELQKFIMSKWFQWRKPLAISSVTFKYSDKIPGGREGLFNGLWIDGKKEHVQVEKLFQTGVVEKINTVLEKLQQPDQAWNSLASQVDVAPDFAAKLMTVGGDSPLQAGGGGAGGYGTTALYSHMSELTAQQNPGRLVPEQGSGSWLRGLLAKKGGLDRSDQQHMARVFAIGKVSPGVPSDRMVVYFDDQGLHLVHVDGLWTVLKQNQGHGQESFKYKDKIGTRLNRRIGYDRFVYRIKPTIREGVSVNDDEIIGQGGYAFNSTIANFYLQYLVNRSYVNQYGQGKSLTQFNVFDNINAFAVLDKTSAFDSGLWYSWIYDFYSYYFQQLVVKPNPDWLQQFIQFGGDNSRWFFNSISNHDASLSSQPTVDFVAAVNKLNESIRNSSDAKGKGVYPRGQFFGGAGDTLDQMITILNNNTLDQQDSSRLWFNGGLNTMSVKQVHDRSLNYRFSSTQWLTNHNVVAPQRWKDW